MDKSEMFCWTVVLGLAATLAAYPSIDWDKKQLILYGISGLLFIFFLSAIWVELKKVKITIED